MKSLLIVTEAFEVGGLETHIKGEVISLTQAGCQVHLATGRRFNRMLLPPEIASLTYDLPLGPEVMLTELIQAVEKLRHIIHEHAIECIHAHPFTSLLPSLIAAELEKIPFVLTLHGPASLASYYGPLYDFILTSILLPNASLVVTVSKEMAELASPYVSQDRIFVLANGINLDIFDSKAITAEQTDPRWLFVSRLDSFKIVGIVDFIRKAKAAGLPGVLLAGDGPAREELTHCLSHDNALDFVELCGTQADIPQLMQSVAGVAGMGRVVLEGLASRKPVCLVGYDGVKGLVDQALFFQASYTNFSGRNLENIDEATLCSQIERLAEINVTELNQVVREHYMETRLWHSFLEKISTLKPITSTVLVDCYHTLIANQISENTPLLRSRTFLEQIGKLAHSLKYSQTALTNSYLYYRDRFNDDNLMKNLTESNERIADLNQSIAERNKQIAHLSQAVAERNEQIVELNQAVAERNEQLAELNQAVAERNEQLAELNQAVAERNQRIGNLNNANIQQSKQLNLITTSASWRLTHPLRKIKQVTNVLKSPESRYQIIRSAYWKLPEFLRWRLNSLRYMYVNRYLASFHNHTDQANVQSIGERKSCPPWLKTANLSTKVAIIPCAFEFDDLVNQRPINAAKYFADEDYFVLFIVWQWNRDEQLSKGCCQVRKNVYQIPLFEFAHNATSLTTNNPDSLFLLTFPAPLLVNLVPTLRQLGFSIVYDIMDEWEEFQKVGQAPWYKRDIEDNLVLQSDFVCAVAPSLSEKFSHLRTDIEIIGNGYSAEIIGSDKCGIAGTLRGTEKIVGYFGHLTDAWFDWNLLFELAESNKDVKYEIIGYGEPGWVKTRIKSVENVTLIGKTHPGNLHSYVSRWSVGIIPFREGKLASAVDPIKIYEYLYFGLSTLVTGIEHVKDYPATVYSSRESIFYDLNELLMIGLPDNKNLKTFLQRSTWRARFSHLKAQLATSRGIRMLYVS